MADKQIVDLTEATNVDDNDLFLIQDTGDINKKVTKKTLLREVVADIDNLQSKVSSNTDSIDSKIDKNSIVNDLNSISNNNQLLGAKTLSNIFQSNYIYPKYNTFADIPPDKNNYTCSVYIDQNEYDSDCPYPSNDLMWWNVFQFGVTSRLTQIASQAFKSRVGYNELWIRNKHDTVWGEWSKFEKSKANIDDIAKTTVNLTGNTGSYTYTIVNGFCTVEFKNIGGLGTDIVFADKSSLPIPILSQSCRLENNGETVGTIYIGGDKASITGHKISDVLGFGTVQYQVDVKKY